MTTKEKIEVMQAYEDGKIIQFRSHCEKFWKDATNPLWNWGLTEYRIKPEPTEPTYRSYRDIEEAFSEAKKHGFMAKFGDTTYKMITCISKENVWTSNTWFDFSGFLKYHVWADDGTPCGICETGE